jgi:hypothetical protein
LPVNHTNKTRIQSYGCSYVAGVELFDHLIDPKADLIKRKRGFIDWITNYVNVLPDGRMAEIDSMGRASAWPAIVAQHYQVDFLNRARGGSSLAESLLTFERDLVEDPNLVNNTLFLFGITHNDRILKFSSLKIQTFMLSMPDLWRDSRLDHRTALELWDETALTWQHLQLLQRLLAVADRSGAAVLIFDSMGFTGNRVWHRKMRGISQPYPYMLPMFDHVWDQIIADPRMCVDQNLQNQPPQVFHGLGHPTISMHQSFSQYVINCIDSRLR